jgi:HD-like signal output (HDOD) protein
METTPDNTPSFQPKTLKEWGEWLSQKEMPIFSGTVQRVSAAVHDDASGALELARAVMLDPALSARVLKLANSIYYNPTRQAVGTLTKAIMLLGANSIQELALTCAFIESIQSAQNRAAAARVIADCLHAAVQAKSLAILAHDSSPEEVFLAALLYNIGHVAFWCFQDEVGARIDALAADGLPAEKAEREVLGFELRELGAWLTHNWKLKGLIEEAFTGKGKNPLRIQIVQKSHTLAKLAQSGQFEPKAAVTCLLPLEAGLRKSATELLPLVQANMQTAARLAAQFGAGDAARHLAQAGQKQAAAPEESEPAPPPGEERRLRLAQIQQDISNLLSERFELNVLFEIILEAIQRGLPMDRTLFALYNRERTELKEKTSIGWPGGSQRPPIRIPVAPPCANLLATLLKGGGSQWARPAEDPETRRLFTAEVRAALGVHDCFLTPLSVTNRPLGLIYADRAATCAALDQETFAHFRHLTQQANIGLKLYQLQTGK